VVRDLKLVDIKTSEPLRIEFLLATPTYERFILIYQGGTGVSRHRCCSENGRRRSYENRLRNWEFDIVVAAWAETLTPVNELREYWGSRAAHTPGSRNLIGIADKALDALIEGVVLAVDRDKLVAATHALDRVLLWHHYVVPQWAYGKIRTARWDRFAKPDHMPSYGLAAFPAIWWWDAERAEKLAAEPRF
jgi:microcin C transport system substrate-binding protein